MCPAAAAAAASYNACPGSNPVTITCPGGELIRSPNPHSDSVACKAQATSFMLKCMVVSN